MCSLTCLSEQFACEVAWIDCSSVQFSHSVGSSLRPHLAHQDSLSITTSRSLLKLRSIKLVCHPNILPSGIPFSACLQSFPVSGSFPVSQFLASGGQTIGVSASASVLPMNIQDWFPLGWTGWISLQSKGLSSLLQHRSSKASILWLNCRVSLIFCGCSVFSWRNLPWILVIIWGLAWPLSSLSKYFPLFHSL